MIKYICMKLIDLYKNSQIHKIINQDIKSGMLNHCYMISGADAYLLDKYTFFLVKEIMCMGDNKPCLECLNCQKIEHSNMVDLCIYPRENKTLMVADINEIVSDCYITPIESKYKIYILKNFDECTIQAQNKILKTLEEPPQNVIFILTSNNENMVLPTILSRSKKLNLNLISSEDCKSVLEDLNVKNSDILASMCGGNLSIALDFSSSGDPMGIVKLIFEMLENLKNSGDVIKFSSRIIALKKDINIFLDTLTIIFRDISVVDNESLVNFKSYINKLKELSKIYTKQAICQIASKVTEVYNKLAFNCNINGVVDKLLLDILEVKFLCQK